MSLPTRRPSIDIVIDVGEVAAALAARFSPEDVASIAATVADLRQYRLELIEAERENRHRSLIATTVHREARSSVAECFEATPFGLRTSA
ncbi:hypothetical protein [Rhizobium sp. M10]|uniref:hypothetical protein n=1 Tax=Rhizobium sp. M10 TaxID=1324586 RepID=UPI001AECBFE2|nr:hypothetical protein [Rhizobium sp. M10]